MPLKIVKILVNRINFLIFFMFITACAAPVPERAIDDVGPVTAYARNELASKNPEGLIRIGEGFERSGDYEGARRLYAQAMANMPDLSEAKIAYARASSKVGRGDEAVAVLTSVLGAEPTNRAAKVALANVHLDAARYQSAVNILKELQFKTGRELAELGKALYALNNITEAETAFARAIDLAPNDPVVLESAALSYALGGKYASAVALLRRAMDTPDHSASARASLAKVYALSGQRQAAQSLARGVMTPEEINKLQYYFRILPRFTPAEQAAALFFNHVSRQAIERISGGVTN